MSDFNDKEMFESAVSDTQPVEATPAPAKETPAPAEAAADDGIARDEKGRFAPKVEDTPAAPVQAEVVPPVAAQQADNAAHVPSWRLREVNDAREAAERRAQDAEARVTAFERQMAEFRQSQPKADPIDVWADPAGAFKQQLTPLEQQLHGLQSNMSLKVSKVMAIVQHGKPAVDEMEKALDEAVKTRHPEMSMLAQQMQNSDDPVSVAMQWYQRDKLLKETGGDLTSYKTKMLEDALKDPAFLAQAMEAARAQASGQAQPNGKPNTTVQLPPSLNRLPSAASSHEEQGSLGDKDLYAFATR